VQVEISGKGYELTDAVKENIRERIKKLTRFDDNIQYVSVVVDKESRAIKNVEARVKLHHSMLVTEESNKDVEAAIHGAFDKMKRRVKRLREKIAKDKTS